MWLVDLSWVPSRHFSLGCWNSPENLGGILHDFHMEMVGCLETALLRIFFHLR